jgi:hypothetical protein
MLYVESCDPRIEVIEVFRLKSAFGGFSDALRAHKVMLLGVVAIMGLLTICNWKERISKQLVVGF